MEEKKSKVVNMKGAEGKQQKLTYEQLNKVCNELFSQNQYLRKQNDELNKVISSINRLGYLFKVLDSYSAANKVNVVTFDPAFVENCIKEIQEAMEIKEEPDREEAKE